MLRVKNKNIKKFVAVTLVVAVVVCVVRTFMFSEIIEPETGLYAVNAQWGHLFDVGVLLLVVAAAVVGRTLFKKAGASAEPDSSSTLTVFGSGLCAFLFFSVFVYGVYKMMFYGEDLSVLYKAQILLCLPSGFNNLMICAKEKREKNISNALLALSAPVMFALRVIDVFMSTDTQINASQRSLELLMLCMMMLFFLYEAAFLVKWEDDSMKKRIYASYYTAALSTVVLTFIATIPYLLVSLFWMFSSASVSMSVLECCVMIYAVTRILTAEIE